MRVLFFTIMFAALFSAGEAFAQNFEYTPMVLLPGMDPTGAGGNSTENFVRILYSLSITLAALLAVVKIIFGGVKWMLSDVVTDKSEAKKDIKGAILGLLIVLGSVLILNTINADLTRLEFFRNAPELSSGSHENLSAQDRANFPNVVDTYEGEFGTSDHLNFIQNCTRVLNGRPTRSENNIRMVECRTK